jgi:transcriptional regulator with XRE-family HTH domain
MTPEDLVRWRERMGWSQVEAAAALGMSRRAYQHLEAGTTSRDARLWRTPLSGATLVGQ